VYEFKQPIVIIHHKGIVDDELIVHHATYKAVSIPTEHNQLIPAL